MTTGRMQKIFENWRKKPSKNIDEIEKDVIKAIEGYVKEVHKREPHEKGFYGPNSCEYVKMQTALIGDNKK